MKIPKNTTIPEVTIEEHTNLINNLDAEYEYIWLFDCRVRVAIINDKLHGYCDVLVCSLSGIWYSIDHCNKESAFNAYLKASHAVASSFIEKSLDKDLQIIGIKRTDA